MRAVEIPSWFNWIFFDLALLQAFAFVFVICQLRGLDPAMRAKVRFDLLETIGGLLLFSGLILSVKVSGSWYWPALPALSSAGYAAKAIQLLRACCRPTT